MLRDQKVSNRQRAHSHNWDSHSAGARAPPALGWLRSRKGSPGDQVGRRFVPTSRFGCWAHDPALQRQPQAQVSSCSGSSWTTSIRGKSAGSGLRLPRRLVGATTSSSPTASSAWTVPSAGGHGGLGAGGQCQWADRAAGCRGHGRQRPGRRSRQCVHERQVVWWRQTGLLQGCGGCLWQRPGQLRLRCR